MFGDNKQKVLLSTGNADIESQSIVTTKIKFHSISPTPWVLHSL